MPHYCPPPQGDDIWYLVGGKGWDGYAGVVAKAAAERGEHDTEQDT